MARLPLTHAKVAEEFTTRGWKLLSRYQNAHAKMDFICGQGHRHQITRSNFKRGNGCGKCCSNEALTQKYVEAEFAKAGWKLHSKYSVNSSKLDITCPKGHSHKITWSNFQKGHGCGKCFEKKFESHAASVLDDLGIPYIREWTGVRRYRVDFYLPDHNIFIEIDEAFHKKQKLADKTRQLRIEIETGTPFERIDATKGMEHITTRIKHILSGSAVITNS